jgi:predicted nucleic acid-binding protein
MKIYIDANVLIATLNKEYPLFPWSSRILSLHGKNNIKLYTSPLCLAIAFYFSCKKSGEIPAKKKIELLSKNILITKIDENITRMAIKDKMVHDFEDGLQYHSALDMECNYIITENREDFYFSKIDILNCKDFLLKISNS